MILFIIPFIIIPYQFIELLERIPKQLQRWKVKSGGKIEELIKSVKSMDTNMTVVMNDLDCLRDTIHQIEIPIENYLPINSQKGLEILFKVMP